MRHSFPLLDRWGFANKQIVTWEKQKIGLGSWLRSKTEFCIMAVRGSPAIHLTNQSTIVHGAAREHSRKPDEFYELVELCAWVCAATIALPASRGPPGTEAATKRRNSLEFFREKNNAQGCLWRGYC